MVFNILIHKFEALGTPPGLVYLIDNFLSNRQCCFKFGERSSYANISVGTTQGTTLGL